MKDNESIIHIYEIKRQIPLAKVRIAAHGFGKVPKFRTAFASKDVLPAELVRKYYESIKGDCAHPFESDAEAFANLEKV